jgi:O-antigen ligase
MTGFRTSPVVWALAPLLVLGPMLTCGIPRVMAPLFIACAVFAVLADCYAREARPDFDKWLAVLFGALLAFGAVSWFWNINPDHTFTKAGQLLGIFAPTVCLVPVIGRLTPYDLKRIGILVATGLGLGIAVYLNEMFRNYPLYALTHGPKNHDIADVKQNKAAVLLALWLYMCFPFFVPRRPIAPRLLFLIAIPVVFYATFGSKSASAQLILACVPVGAVILYFIPARFSLALTLFVTGFMAVSMPFVAYSIAHHTQWQTSTTINDSVKSRIEIWDQAARRSFEKPILGWGLDAAPLIPNRDDKSYNSAFSVHHLHPHNGLLQVWEELGAVGVLMLCALFKIFYVRIRTMADTAAQKYAVFMWAVVFLYTLSIWGIWQTWFTATLTFMGLMTYAGTRQISLKRPAP